MHETSRRKKRRQHANHRSWRYARFSCRLLASLCKQILYFLDPVFSERSQIKTPLKSDRLVPEKQEKAENESPAVYTVEPENTASETPEYNVENEPDFNEEPTYDGEEPDFDEPDFEEPDFEEETCSG